MTPEAVTILAPVSQEQSEILTPEALNFLAVLHKNFNHVRKQLLQRRVLRQQEIDRGHLPDFLPETKHIRENEAWKGAPPAPGLIDRRVEITGPVDRKMVINALNSGATQFMADFEDSSSPTWNNMVNGQYNLRDALRRTISFKASNGKEYRLREDGKVATLIVRPRGWHMEEKHVLIHGEPCSASLFDFGLFFFHNAKQSLEIGAGPYFYLPKIESHLEARLWNDVFNLSQDMLGIPRGTIRATVLIETILAAFEMEEIIYELRDHSSGLNCGRWDYIFSLIKKFRHNPKFVLPQRSDVTMTVPFMDSYTRLVVKTCHKRGVHAMGGMAAQIPVKDNPQANDAALAKVKADKLREAKGGHDGTWVAHPALIPIAKEMFDQYMQGPNQFHIRREETITALDLINMNVPGSITEQGIRDNISVALTYMEAWLCGTGCVPINNLMEDAATAEISRSQLWQWVRHQSVTAEGRTVTSEWMNTLLEEECNKIRQRIGHQKYAASKFDMAKNFLKQEMSGNQYSDFLTTLCYDCITDIKPQHKL